MKTFFLALTITLLSLQPAHAITRMLAVIDRNAPDVGPGCEKSYHSLKHFLIEKTKDHRDEFDIEEYKNPPTPGDIIKHYLTDRRIGPGDVLWFFYCGHGITDALGEHILDMVQGQLKRSELRKTMESRNPRGVIITTDACGVSGTYEDNGPVGQGAPPIPVNHWPVLKSLFDNTEGTVDMTAATGRSRAFIDPEKGANFTVALTSTLRQSFSDLDSSGDGKITWDEVFQETRLQTQFNFSQMANKVAQNRSSTLQPDDKNQVPFAYSLGKNNAGFHAHATFAEENGVRGTRYHMRTQFLPEYAGKKIQFQMTFWNTRNQQIAPVPGTRQFVDIVLNAEQVSANDNKPWLWFVSDRTVQPPIGADGRPEGYWVMFTIWDLSRTPAVRLAQKAYFTQPPPGP